MQHIGQRCPIRRAPELAVIAENRVVHQNNLPLRFDRRAYSCCPAPSVKISSEIKYIPIGCSCAASIRAMKDISFQSLDTLLTFCVTMRSTFPVKQSSSSRHHSLFLTAHSEKVSIFSFQKSEKIAVNQWFSPLIAVV